MIKSVLENPHFVQLLIIVDCGFDSSVVLYTRQSEKTHHVTEVEH